MELRLSTQRPDRRLADCWLPRAALVKIHICRLSVDDVNEFVWVYLFETFWPSRSCWYFDIGAEFSLCKNTTITANTHRHIHRQIYTILWYSNVPLTTSHLFTVDHRKRDRGSECCNRLHDQRIYWLTAKQATSNNQQQDNTTTTQYTTPQHLTWTPDNNYSISSVITKWCIEY